MFCPVYPARDPGRSLFPKCLFLSFLVAVLIGCAASAVAAQSFNSELETPEKVALVVRNRDGRVSVVATEEQQKKVSIEARSAGAPVDPSDIKFESKGARIAIEVRSRRPQDRIDIFIRVPVRSKVEIESDAGSVDVVGNLESATVITDTGTIHADIPLDAVKFDFMWLASKPRYMSDVELPEIKEKAGGVFRISGKLGDEKAKKEARIQLNLQTRRGVILLNVDPSLATADLRERPLTEAARAIVRSGDPFLVDAIRKGAPKMFGDYARTLPPLEREPTLRRRTPPGQIVSSIAPQLKRFNASVTDRNGRAIGGMRETDFTVYENGIERRVTNVVPTNEPFNLVLLLDVSGSVEERMDFIRKAARDFLKTTSPQDRIAIISFRDDIQVLSDFTTDRRLLSEKLDQIAAGGGTALYDAIGYVLVEALKQFRGERTAVVILSDGDDNKSFVPFPAILDALSESGALV
jgi:hypothetical protein